MCTGSSKHKNHFSFFVVHTTTMRCANLAVWFQQNLKVVGIAATLSHTLDYIFVHRFSRGWKGDNDLKKNYLLINHANKRNIFTGNQECGGSSEKVCEQK